MSTSLDESMSGDMKDLEFKMQSWEQNMMAIFTDIETHVSLADDKVVQLKSLVTSNISKIKEMIYHSREKILDRAKSSKEHQHHGRVVHRPIISSEWFELAEESIFKNCLLRNLQLSYHSLGSPQLKLCLLSFAIFPENSIIKKRTLIYWWIGEGLVYKKGDKTAEQVGEEVYDELIKQGLIEPDDPSPLMNRCKIHPCIRYMILSLAQEAGFFYFNSKDETPKCSFSSSHLLLLLVGKKYREPTKVEDLSTVFNVNQRYLSQQPQWLSNMKKLAVLQLGRWLHSPKYHIEVDDQRFLNDLQVHHTHLKFLSLRGISRITTLPDSIIHLVSLEILDLRACHNLEKLPHNIASLKKLTHLDVSECYLIERIPKGTGKLSSLQVLKGFVIGTVRKDSCKISDLGNLPKLRRLSVYIGRGLARTGAEFAPLMDVKSLCSLSISWGVTCQALHAKAAENWDFPQHLEKLELIGMPEKQMPALTSVKKLYIIGGDVESVRPPTESDSVEILRLKYLQKLKNGNKEEVLTKFPKLVYFERKDCAGGDELWDKNKEIKK